MSEELNKKIANATKWSGITEIVAKLITPISNMLLARLLTPEAFGVVATLTMIISFAELFTDAGFQKYLVQHEFENREDRNISTNVAFWSNFVLSFLIWIVIIVFSNQLASIVGNPGLGMVLSIACVSIPLAAFSSIQMALLRRDFEFKVLFKVRVVSIIIPLLVTIPFALLLRSYWALIIGTIIQNLVNAVLLTMFSNWKPQFTYSCRKLKDMLSFTIWSLFEAISVWLTSYLDVFIVGTMLSQYYLGLYKTSTALVGQIMGLITAATSPVLFSSLSRLQNDNVQFKNVFFKFQNLVSLLIMPLGIGIFCYDDLITMVMLGEQWKEASPFLGLWGLTSAITIVLSHYASELYRAKGSPRTSTIVQWLHIVFLLPVILIAVKYGFVTLYIARSLARFELIIVNLIALYILVKITPREMIMNVSHSIIGGASMMVCALVLQIQYQSYIWTFVTGIISLIVYFTVIMLFPKERALITNLFLEKIKKHKY